MAKMVEDSMTSGEEVLDKAEKFMNEREKHEPVPVEVNLVDLVQGQGTGNSNLENTLRPDTLSSTMTLEELTILSKKFEAYLEWNKKALEKKSITDLRHLLESCLNASLATKLDMDEMVSDTTKVQGADSCLDKIKNFLNGNPLMMRLHQFRIVCR